MANSDLAFGLKPVRMLDGSPFNGCVDMFYVPSSDGTAYFVGDPVKPSGSADSAGVMAVALCAAGDPILGAVVGFADVASMELGYRAASTASYVLVAHGQDILFEIQEDSDGGALAAVDVGLNAAIIVAAGSTFRKLSGVELDTSTKNTTATLALRIRGLPQRPDNAIGANAKVLVSLNEAFDTPGTASDGL
jgi:hypothetical protein